MSFSHEYVGAIVIVIVSLLKAFGVDIGNEEVTTIVTGFVALWIAIRRFSKGDVTLGGLKK